MICHNPRQDDFQDIDAKGLDKGKRDIRKLVILYVDP